MLLALLGAFHDRGQLRHADAGDHAGGADRARADPDLDRIRTSLGQRPCGFRGGDIARNHLDRIGQFLDPLDRARDLLVVAMRGVDYHHIDLGIDQRLGALETGITDRGRRGDAQPPGLVLGGVGIGDRLLDILDRDQTDAMAVVVDHQQLLDPPLVQQPARFFLAGAERHGREIVGGHQLADRLERVLGEADVAIGDDADQPAGQIGHRDAADAVGRHQLLRLAQRRIGVDGDRVDDHAALVALDRAHRGDLFGDQQIAVEHADPAHLRHGDRHVGLGDRVHRAGDDRDVERNRARQPGRGVRHRGQDIALGRTQEHVVEGQAEGDLHECHFLYAGGFVAAHVTTVCDRR